MSFKAPPNSALISRAKIRVFDGIFGSLTKVLRRTNDRGNDISNTASNDIVDFDLNEDGTIKRRGGKRKISTTGYSSSVNSIFMVNLDGFVNYGVLSGGDVDLIGLLWYSGSAGFGGGRPIEDKDILEPLDPPIPLDPYPLPPDFPRQKRPDIPLDDPSVPPEAQSCEVSIKHTISTATLEFEAWKYEDPPIQQYYYYRIRGWWTQTLTGVFTTAKSWYSNYRSPYRSRVSLGPCDEVKTQGMTVHINDVNDMETGIYTDVIGLDWNDGVVQAQAVKLTVKQEQYYCPTLCGFYGIYKWEGDYLNGKKIYPGINPYFDTDYPEEEFTELYYHLPGGAWRCRWRDGYQPVAWAQGPGGCPEDYPGNPAGFYSINYQGIYFTMHYSNGFR